MKDLRVCVGVINICKNLTVKIPLSTKSNCSDCTALTHQTERPSPLLLSQTGSQIIEICRFNPQYSLKDSRPKKCSFCSFSLKNLYGFMQPSFTLLPSKMVEPLENDISETKSRSVLLNHCKKKLNVCIFYLFPTGFLLSFDILIVEVTQSNTFKNRLLSDIFLPSYSCGSQKVGLSMLGQLFRIFDFSKQRYNSNVVGKCINLFTSVFHASKAR